MVVIFFVLIWLSMAEFVNLISTLMHLSIVYISYPQFFLSYLLLARCLSWENLDTLWNQTYRKPNVSLCCVPLFNWYGSPQCNSSLSIVQNVIMERWKVSGSCVFFQPTCRSILCVTLYYLYLQFEFYKKDWLTTCLLNCLTTQALINFQSSIPWPFKRSRL